jgi:hypothetical protein
MASLERGELAFAVEADVGHRADGAAFWLGVRPLDQHDRIQVNQRIDLLGRRDGLVRIAQVHVGALLGGRPRRAA